MRLLPTALFAISVALASVGCHARAEDQTSSASLTVGGHGVSFKANDDKGAKADLHVGNASLDIHDGEGGGFSFNMDEKTGSFKFKAGDKDGKFENDLTLTEDDLGMPFYPGSSEVRVLCMRAESKEEKSVIAVRHTSDGLDKVIEYYKPMLTGISSATEANSDHEEMKIEGTDKGGAKVGISAHRDAGKSETTVTVARTVKK